VASNVVNACTACRDNDEARRRQRPFLPSALLLFVPGEEESWNDRITDTIGERSQLSSLDSRVETEAVDDLVFSLVVAGVTTSLEGSRLKILVNEGFNSLLI